jgi:hypothetical protein
MKTAGIVVVAVLIVGADLALHGARAQQPGLNRMELLRHDLSSTDARSFRYVSS